MHHPHMLALPLDGIEQAEGNDVETELGIGAHHHAVERAARPLRVEAHEGLNVRRRDQLDALLDVPFFRGERGELERIESAVRVAVLVGLDLRGHGKGVGCLAREIALVTVRAEAAI